MEESILEIRPAAAIVAELSTPAGIAEQSDDAIFQHKFGTLNCPTSTSYTNLCMF